MAEAQYPDIYPSVATSLSDMNLMEIFFAQIQSKDPIISKKLIKE